MNRKMTDGQTDFWLLLALSSWAIACVVPPISMLPQFVSILMLVPRCNVKVLPALPRLTDSRGL